MCGCGALSEFFCPRFIGTRERACVPPASRHAAAAGPGRMCIVSYSVLGWLQPAISFQSFHHQYISTLDYTYEAIPVLLKPE